MSRFALLLVAVACTSVAPAGADEGMWTFDNPPLRQLKERHAFEPSPEWLERVRLASVRFMDGGSGSFVSREGLVVTNHHVGLGCIQNLSSAQNDYVGQGFLAPSRGLEPACPGYEVNVVTGFEDVSARVLGSVQPGMSDAQARDARKAAIANAEKECAEATSLRCNVVTLYQGSEFHLYRYKKYTDVRLVFAPEQQIAFFGGDPDNFTYPRHDLDVAFFRVYENGQPVRPAAHLPWSREGTKEGDLVFVSGNPGSTSRLNALAQLVSERDVQLPLVLKNIERRLALLRAYSEKGPEQARRAKAQVFGLENAVKALRGRLQALRDDKAMARKADEEGRLREFFRAEAARVQAERSATERPSGETDPWEAIGAARKKADARVGELQTMGFAASRLLAMAGQIVRHGVETGKPNEQRLEEFSAARLPSLMNQLYSPAPIYDDLEETTLTDQLQLARETLGADHPYVKAVLGGRSPAEVVREAVGGTRLKDVAARKALIEGGEKAVAASSDPMILLARKIDPFGRDLRRFVENEVEAVITRAGERIARARFKAFGRAVHPDATFTLRLSYGTVSPYPAEGTVVPTHTTFHGLFDRSAAFGGKPPWDLPPRWLEKKAALDLATPLNFVSSADIIGGNSGSPTINRKGEFVGIIFDSNIQGLALDYFYTDEQARAVSVDARGIVEALRNVYEAKALVEELLPS